MSNMGAQVAQKQDKLLSLEIYYGLLPFYFPCLLCVVAVKDHGHWCCIPAPPGPTFLYQLSKRHSCCQEKARNVDIPVGLPAQRAVGGSWRHTWIFVPLQGHRLWVRPITQRRNLMLLLRMLRKDGRLRRIPYKQRIMISRYKEQAKYCGSDCRLSRKE